MAPRYAPKFFPNTSNSMIVNPTVTVSTHISPNPSERHGLRVLLENISKGAVYNAAERGDPPRCHPHTRLAIRQDIMEWITAPPAMRKLILWMYGLAGSGKTAIAQSITEECALWGLLAASFFFWRTAAGRNDASRFVATIAYQLSRYIPQMEEHILTAIEQDPTIFSLSFSTQMRVLVIEPLKLAAPSLPMLMFAVVDGVDKCGPDGRAQSELLHLLASVASEFQYLPLIFLIASCPEYEIRQAFSGNFLSPLTKILVLDNNYQPDEDIRTYFDSTFQKIVHEHHQLGRRLPSSWPTASDINILVSKASGQFIFASTVTRFIDSPRHDPTNRMNIILNLSNSGNETPFALLDALYRFVLDSVADVDKVLDILAFLLLGHDSIDSLDEAEELLGIEFRSALIDMHSLVRVSLSPNDTIPTVYHASLEDFLMDQSRSCQYYIGRFEGHLRLTRHSLRAMANHRHLRHLDKRTLILIFSHYVHKLPPSDDLVDDLAHFDLRSFLEGISDFRGDLYDTEWNFFFNSVKQQAGSDQLDVFLRLQNDFDAFILNRITQYPPSLRTHIPILLHHVDWRSPELFVVLCLGASSSAHEYNEFLNLDKSLLNVCSSWYDLEKREGIAYVLGLFGDKSRAREYFPEGKSYVALVKEIVNVIYVKPGERHFQARFETKGVSAAVFTFVYAQYSEHGYDVEAVKINFIAIALEALPSMLEIAPTDQDLAGFLCERVVQFRNDMEPIEVWRKIAEASVKYIQRCGIPFLEHSHQPDMNECAICTLCEDAVVVEDISDLSSDASSELLPDPSSEWPLLLPGNIAEAQPPLPDTPTELFLPPPTIEEIDFMLAAVQEFDGTPAYPFTHRMEITEAPDGGWWYSFTGEPPFGHLK